MKVSAARMPSLNRRLLLLALCCILLAPLNAPQGAAQSNALQDKAVEKPALTADQIVARLQERNRGRELALHGLQGTRIYRAHYTGFFGARDAEAVVSYRYVSPSRKEFTVQSQSGAKFILNHVIHALLDGEKEAATAEHRQRTALGPTNYDFTLAETESAREPSQYVLNALPKHDDKFLYRGKIWVDAKDFAVTRIEAEPAKSPSFWIKKTEVHHRYKKIGDFWLPAVNETESTMRMGGRAVLSIEYNDYAGIERVPPASIASAVFPGN